MTPEERELSRLFEAARRADESAAPDLDALLARGPRPRRSAGRAIAFAAAATLLLAIAVLLVRHDARTAPAPEAPVQLADWESPTAFLLDTPGSELLTEIPTLAPSTAKENDSSHQPTKGVER
jgi:hypothetical protein